MLLLCHEERGSEFYKEIGRKGGERRGSKIIGTKVMRGRRRRAEVGRIESRMMRDKPTFGFSFLLFNFSFKYQTPKY